MEGEPSAVLTNVKLNVHLQVNFPVLIRSSAWPSIHANLSTSARGCLHTNWRWSSTAFWLSLELYRAVASTHFCWDILCDSHCCSARRSTNTRHSRSPLISRERRSIFVATAKKRSDGVSLANSELEVPWLNRSIAAESGALVLALG